MLNAKTPNGNSHHDLELFNVLNCVLLGQIEDEAVKQEDRKRKEQSCIEDLVI